MRVNLDLKKEQDKDISFIRVSTGRLKQHIYDEAFALGLEAIKLRVEDELYQEAGDE